MEKNIREKLEDLAVKLDTLAVQYKQDAEQYEKTGLRELKSQVARYRGVAYGLDTAIQYLDLVQGSLQKEAPAPCGVCGFMVPPSFWQPGVGEEADREYFKCTCGIHHMRYMQDDGPADPGLAEYEAAQQDVAYTEAMNGNWA